MPVFALTAACRTLLLVPQNKYAGPVVLIPARSTIDAIRMRPRAPWRPTEEAKVTPDLKYLVYTAMLTAALWIPYIVCQVRTNGPLQPANYRDPDQPRPVPPWGQRAHRTYLNAVEVFAPFAALVVAAHLTGKADAMTAFWSASFFWLRLAHAVVYFIGIPYLRTVLFTLAFIAEAGIFWEIVR